MCLSVTDAENAEVCWHCTVIKRIVLQIIAEWEKRIENLVAIPQELAQMPIEKAENDLLKGFDENDLNGIMESLAAFKEQ